jgi:hypothetical protein
MKGIKILALVAFGAGLAANLDTQAQGTFQNLNFEGANVPFVPAGQFGADVAVSNGVPGWNVYIGGGRQVTMFHNNISLGGAAVAIFGPEWLANQILEGSYTVSLEPSTAGPPTSTAIGQIGIIPLGSQSVRFYGGGAMIFSLTFAGQPIPLVTLSSTANYTIFGGDISAFAGQSGELRFRGGGLLDNVFFSPSPVPEPKAIYLLALGIFVLRLARSRPRPS